MTNASIADATRQKRIKELKTEILVRVEGHNLIASSWGVGATIFLTINVVLSAITASSLFKVLLVPEAIPAIFAILVAINSGLMALFEPSKKVEEHRVAIAKYREAKLINDHGKLQQKMAEIERESPLLRFKTRSRAIKRLKKLRELPQDF